MNKLVEQFQELNINNYDHDDVFKLNAWAIAAADEIEALEDKVVTAIKAFEDIISAANRL
jgi:hypothetical protein